MTHPPIFHHRNILMKIYNMISTDNGLYANSHLLSVALPNPSAYTLQLATAIAKHS